MGVTVHFEGRLRGEKAYADLLRSVEETAEAKTWLTERFENGEVTLLRVREERSRRTTRDQRRESFFTFMKTAIRSALNSIVSFTFRSSSRLSLLECRHTWN